MKDKIINFVIVVFVVVVIAINAYYFLYKRNPSEQAIGEVVEAMDIENDGGLIYQNLLVSLKKEKYELKYELSPNQKELSIGEKVILSGEGESLKILDVERGKEMVIILISFIILLLLATGLKNFEYILPMLIFGPFLLSGLLIEIISKIHIFLFIFPMIIIISSLVSFQISRKLRISLVVTASTLITMLLSFLIIYILTHLLNVEDLYYGNYQAKENLTPKEFWNLFYMSVILISFGAVINNSIHIANMVSQITEKNSSAGSMIYKIIESSQKIVASQINNLFFVMAGLSLIQLLLVTYTLTNFWNDAIIIQSFIFFISSAFAVILSVPLSAIIATFFENSNLIKKFINNNHGGKIHVHSRKG